MESISPEDMDLFWMGEFFPALPDVPEMAAGWTMLSTPEPKPVSPALDREEVASRFALSWDTAGKFPGLALRLD